MPLFAIIDKNVASSILRIDTDKKTDVTLSELFHDQASQFMSHHSNGIIFCAGYKPSYGERFEIDKFKGSTALLDAVKRNTAIPKWDPSKVKIENIKALFMPVKINNTDYICLQTFNKGQVLDISKSLFLSNQTFTMANTSGFNIDDKAVAVIENDKIYFRSFHKLRSIFNMDSYFVSATDKQVTMFSCHSKFEVAPGFDLNTVADTVVRTKITLIQNSKILETESISALKKAATKVNFPLKTIGSGKNEKIVMPSEKKEIKKLLDFLEEDIFTAEISKKIYKSNSKRPYK
ncbi:DUF4868 domain-containing protein [Citrobacter sp. wls713]|uniref:Kiwa anti-phage protein KwaB-like domain-containing protein n=1 Tax=unclassified Citrobacter TaxID=2644389 RepID=UPI0010C9DBD3|nr:MULTISPECIES: Kiwa anti-phage protein KwaB-like domain-containing protein [unclassified Citrobacter]TKU59824.1 DUF4868 domain-containing protein [Citrobacter sp. wls713]TKV03633.1 DUF4868 domain-containing protein [Citrobacter sp. wls621]